MKIAVAGLWHLGCVTSACCAREFDVIGFDSETSVIESLNTGKAPVSEPGLDELVASGLASGRLQFTSDPKQACAQADVLWITYDTPVNDDDQSDVIAVIDQTARCVPFMRPGATVLVSSQIPVGTCRMFESQYPAVKFACSPENLQLGKAIHAFDSPARIVVGTRNGESNPLLAELLSRFCQNIIWMKTESAEMVKHGLNSYLALSIAFTNELAAICEQTGADANEVSSGLKSDPRIGPRAYLSPGAAFAGGTLARDIVTLMKVGAEKNLPLDVISAVKRSNDRHRGWALRRLLERLSDLRGRRIALLGLTYKPGTNTLRRSSALELARSLVDLGASVSAFDPAINAIENTNVRLTGDALSAAQGADALVICTEWPEFLQIDCHLMVEALRCPLVLDPNRFLEKKMTPTRAEYLSVGRS